MKDVVQIFSVGVVLFSFSVFLIAECQNYAPKLPYRPKRISNKNVFLPKGAANGNYIKSPYLPKVLSKGSNMKKSYLPLSPKVLQSDKSIFLPKGTAKGYSLRRGNKASLRGGIGRLGIGRGGIGRVAALAKAKSNGGLAKNSIGRGLSRGMGKSLKGSLQNSIEPYPFSFNSYAVEPRHAIPMPGMVPPGVSSGAGYSMPHDRQGNKLAIKQRFSKNKNGYLKRQPKGYRMPNRPKLIPKHLNLPKFSPKARMERQQLGIVQKAPYLKGHVDRQQLGMIQKAPYSKGQMKRQQSGMVKSHGDQIDKSLLASLLSLPLEKKLPNPLHQSVSPMIQVHPIQPLPAAPQFPLMVGPQGPIFEHEGFSGGEGFNFFTQPAIFQQIGDKSIQMEKKVVINSMGAQVQMSPVVQFSNNAVRTENVIQIKHGDNAQPIILKADGLIKVDGAHTQLARRHRFSERENDDESHNRDPKPKRKPKKKQKKKKAKKADAKKISTANKATGKTTKAPPVSTTDISDYVNAVSDLIEWK